MVILGRRVESLKRTRGPEYGEAKALYKAMKQDLDEALKGMPPEVRGVLSSAITLTKQAGTSERISRMATTLPARTAFAGGTYMAGGGIGALPATFAPDIIRAGLESSVGRNTIASMAKNGANWDQIVNALVQLGIKAVPEEEPYKAPWEPGFTP